MQKRGLIIVFIALVILLLAALASSEDNTQGCYYFPQASSDLFCTPVSHDLAEQDCQGCDINQYFTPGSGCSEIPICKDITCSDDCSVKKKGLCDQAGGVEVSSEQYNYHCNPGCCSIHQMEYCGFASRRSGCEQLAKNRLGFVPTDYIFSNAAGTTQHSCQAFCHQDVSPATLTVIVSDGQNPLQLAQVTLEGRAQRQDTNSEGKVSFTPLSPSSYQVTVTKANFASQTKSVDVQSAETKELAFTLVQTQMASLSGHITAAGAVVHDASVFYEGPGRGFAPSDSQGAYTISDIQPGSYTLIYSHPQHQEQRVTLNLVAGGNTKDIELIPLTFSGISGTTYLDRNSNNVADQDEMQYGVRVLIDGIFKGLSQYPSGTFSYDVAQTASQISAEFDNGRFSYGPQPLSALGRLSLVLLLKASQKECTIGNLKIVENAQVENVKGSNELKLSWRKPCPEVIGYNIKRSSGAETLDLGDQPVNVLSFIDGRNMDWNTEYSYEIRALYPDAPGQSEPVRIGPLSTGNQKCEHRYHLDTGWESFCMGDNSLTGDRDERRSVFTCDDQNRLVESPICAALDTDTDEYYCAQTNAREAYCKSQGPCAKGGKPFGLFYSRDSCYGVSNLMEGSRSLHFCYYDTAATIVDQCKACTALSSCFDYQSQDACTTNSCLSEQCRWIEGASNLQLVDYSAIFPGLHLPSEVSSETGHGYCTPQNYDKNDKCQELCSGKSTLFENNYCTADICTALGRCFSGAELKKCESCPDYPTNDANCYQYKTQLECSAGENAEYDSQQRSKDSCRFGVCRWDGSCFKDGNGDGVDDCQSLGASTRAAASQQQACRKDILSPRTQMLTASPVIISRERGNVSFGSDDEFHTEAAARSGLHHLGYCLAQMGAPDQCDPDTFAQQAFRTFSPKQEVDIDILESSYVQSRAINGESFRLKYYAEDKYGNREPVQEAAILIDNVAPEFEMLIGNTTVADKTRVNVTLVSAEPLSCSVTLTPLWPLGERKQVHLEMQDAKFALFENLQVVVVKVNATCSDAQGNNGSKQQMLTFNLDQSIEIVHPRMGSYVATFSIPFKVKTAVASSCALLQRGQKIANFQSDAAEKEHQTDAIPGFVQGEYAGIYSVQCAESLDISKKHSAFFQFGVDFVGPQTRVIIKEGTREVIILPKRGSLPNDNWEEAFIRSVNVSFRCESDGFPCQKTLVCFGENCDPFPGPGYREAQPFSINQSSKICYYSTDSGDGLASVLCGKVIIDGFGITLEKPPLYHFEGEPWGISNTPIFDLQFFTRIPTSECTLDFSEDFAYEAQPEFKRKTPNAGRRYIYTEFPQSLFTSYPQEGGIKSVFAQCKTSSGEIGPEQKLNLEYDPTAPQILEAYAEPSLVLEGIRTQLRVKTDDKAICRYSDNSQGQGSSEFRTMEHLFGQDESALRIVHKDSFSIPFLGAVKNYSLNLMCKNGAENVSELRTINFSVDYTAAGNIIALRPSGYLSSNAVTLEVETSKDARCEFKTEQGNFSLLLSGNARLHTASLSGLNDKEYRFPVRCRMGDQRVENAISFTIDRTAPMLRAVEDGNYSCGRREIKIMVYSDEQAISGYYYELYDAGLANQTRNATQVMVANDSVGPQLPIEIPISQLNASHKYLVKVRAVDAAGNVGPLLQSDGFTITPRNYSVCVEEELPRVDILTNATCSAVLAELRCASLAGCHNLTFGKQGAQSLCRANQSYIGQKIFFDRPGYLCFAAESNSGKKSSGSQLIAVQDKDADGVFDICDKCPDSKAGRVVDAKGCSSDQDGGQGDSQDTDNDKLPDSWEEDNDKPSCQFDPKKRDSDGNGISDAEDDYDSDGLSNYREYLLGRDPCVADKVPTPEPTPEPKPGRGEEPGSGTGAVSASLLPELFLLLGLLLFALGLGYLVYDFRRPKKPQGGVGAPSITGVKTVSPGKLKDLITFNKALRERSKERERQQLFEPFGQRPSVSATKTKEQKAAAEADKDVFSRLETISSAKKEEDVFAKLSEIGQKKKGKK